MGPPGIYHLIGMFIKLVITGCRALELRSATYMGYRRRQASRWVSFKKKMRLEWSYKCGRISEWAGRVQARGNQGTEGTGKRQPGKQKCAV